MNTKTTQSESQDNDNILENKVQQNTPQCQAEDKSAVMSGSQLPPDVIDFRKKILWNPDPEICFRNLLKFGTNERARLKEFEVYANMFRALGFDGLLNIDLNMYRPVFKLYYNGFKKGFKSSYVKNSALYGPEAFAWNIRTFLTESDYQFKKQKIKAEEFEIISYFLTDLCFKQGNDCMVHSNYFLADGKQRLSNKERYKKYSSRKLNIDKLNHIINVLTKYDIIIEKKVGVRGKTHLRNFYSIGKNNVFYGYKPPEPKKEK